jgi:CheY-like chemotaxis protein
MKEREGIRAKPAKSRRPKRTAPKRRAGQKVRGSASLILILSDINMRGMSGVEELLPKAKAVRPDVSVIMIMTDADTKRKASESGAESLFTKPIDLLVLRNEIEMRVERAV